jgi:monothiol glutaredoxin
VLTHMGVKFNSINVLEDAEIREGIKEYSDWPTIPQLYVKNEFVGGCDIIREMHENGELNDYFNNAGISV